MAVRCLWPATFCGDKMRARRSAVKRQVAASRYVFSMCSPPVGKRKRPPVREVASMKHPRLGGGPPLAREPDHRNDDLTGTGTVKLNQKHPLPLAQGQATVDDGHGLTGTEEEMLAMSMAVGALVSGHVHGASREIVVLILRRSRGQLA